MKDSRFKYIKNLKLRQETLKYLSIGMIFVGGIMLINSNTTDIVGPSLIYGGVYAAGISHEYWNQANTIIGESKDRPKQKKLK